MSKVAVYQYIISKNQGESPANYFIMFMLSTSSQTHKQLLK